MKFFLKHWRLIGVCVFVALIPVSYQIGYWDGGAAAKKDIQIKVVEKIVEVQKKNEKRKTEIRRLDDDALVRRYCKWVYDVPFDECVRTVKPIE